MARSSTTHVCSACGHESVKWHGPLPGLRGVGDAGRGGAAREAAGRGGRGGSRSGKALTPVPLAEVEAPRVARLRTGIGELDRVLGGGLVPGSLVLLGGSPGIGKSTITASALGNLSAAGHSVLYVSGEESAAQVRLRAERLGAGRPERADRRRDRRRGRDRDDRGRAPRRLRDRLGPGDARRRSSPARPAPSARSARSPARLMRVAKERGVAVILVGHVTKEGALAGPRVLEHLVDCVLSFEGERERTYRTLRALKNRFGSTNEAGVFEMRDEGLVEVEDASARFVAEATRAPGSVILCAMEGSRPLLVEVQALVAPTEMVPPRRMANGVDRNRLALVLAVLARHSGITVGTADVFVSLAGGVRIDEPGADLAVALAVASAARGRPARARQHAAGRVRRARADRRAPPRRASRPAARGGEEVRPRRRAGAGRGTAGYAGCAARLAGRCGGPRRSTSGLTTEPFAQFRTSRRFQRHSPYNLRVPYSGDDVSELEARQEPRLVRALEMIAPGTAVREGIDSIVQARSGGLICSGTARSCPSR